jgi:hypothetical protein
MSTDAAARTRSSGPLVRAGAVAAGVGGAVWLLKGGVLLLVGQDSLGGIDLRGLFVVAQGLFGLALVGLHHHLVAVAPEPVEGEIDRRESDPDVPLPGQGRGGTKATVGLWLAYLAVGLAVVNAVLQVLPGAITQTAAGLTGLLLSLSWVSAAGLIGIVVARRRALPPPAHRIPFWLGLWTIPLLVVFGIASNFLGNMWLELPVVLVGAAWLPVGAALWSPLQETG